MAIKGILPPPFKMIVNTFYPLLPQPPRPSTQCDVPLRRPPVQQSPPQQQCSGTRVVVTEEMTVERSAKNVCIEGHTEGRMNPKRGQLESSSAGTGFETPRQQCLPNWEVGRTTVDGCLLVGVSSNLGGNTFSLTELAIGTWTDSQTSAPSASSNTVFLQTSRKPGNSEPAGKENKQFDPGGKGGEPPL